MHTEEPKTRKKIKEKKIAQISNKIIRSIFPYVLIVDGAFLNIWFHVFRFNSENIEYWLAAFMGILITAMINTLTLVYLEKYKIIEKKIVLNGIEQLIEIKKRNKFILVILLVVAVYDILSTSAGQSIFLHTGKNEAAIKQSQTNEEIIKKQIAVLDSDIEELDIDYKSKSELIRESVVDLSTAFDYKNTIAKLEKEKTDIWNKKELKEKERNQLLDSLKTDENNLSNVLIRNIYQYYGDLFTKPSWEGWTQFIMHLALSFLISGAAPLGIYLKSPQERREKKEVFQPEKKEEEKPEIIKEPQVDKKAIYLKEVKAFSRVAFNWMMNKNKPMFPDKKFIVSQSKLLAETFTDEKFDKIVKSAINRGLLRNKTDGLYPAADILDSETFINRFIS